MTSFRTKIVLALAVCAVAIPIKTFAATVGTPLTATPMGSGDLTDSCTLTPTPGALGFALNRRVISTDPTTLGAGYTGTATPAALAVASNLVSGTPDVILDAAVLTGDTAGASLTLIGTGTYAASTTFPIPSTGQISSVPINVQFTKSSDFVAGTYSSVATVTCTNDGTK